MCSIQSDAKNYAGTVFRCWGVFRVNLQFAINDHWAVWQLHNWTVQLHYDVFDGGVAASLSSSYLDVEVVVAAPAWGGQDVVAGGVQLEHVSIKGLEVEVSPCTANLTVVDGTHSYKDKWARDTTKTTILYTSLDEWKLTYCLHKKIVTLSLLPTTNKLTFYFLSHLGHGGKHCRLCLCWKK